jgi:hypothetical protein
MDIEVQFFYRQGMGRLFKWQSDILRIGGEHLSGWRVFQKIGRRACDAGGEKEGDKHQEDWWCVDFTHSPAHCFHLISTCIFEV